MGEGGRDDERAAARCNARAGNAQTARAGRRIRPSQGHPGNVPMPPMRSRQILLSTYLLTHTHFLILPFILRKKKKTISQGPHPCRFGRKSSLSLRLFFFIYFTYKFFSNNYLIIFFVIDYNFFLSESEQ